MRLTPGFLRFRWHAACVALGTTLVLLLTFDMKNPILSEFNLRLQDWLMRITTTQDLPDNFLLVGLDDASLSVDTLEPEEIEASKALQLMNTGFPFSREVYALAGQKILDAGAKLVIFDFVFPGPNPGDAAFAAFMEKNPRRFVVGAQFDDRTYRKPFKTLSTAAKDGIGFVNIVPDRGIIRRTRLFGTISEFRKQEALPDEYVEPAMATVAAQILGKDLPQDTRKRRFRFSRPLETAQKVSLQQLFIPSYWKSKNRNWEIFKNRVVLLGPTADGLKDFHETPLGKMAGPEVQLQILAAALRDSWLSETESWVDVVFILLAAGAILALAAFRKSAFWFSLFLVAGLVIWGAVCIGALAIFSWFLPIAQPLAAWLACGFLVLTFDATLDRRERARMRRTLERYVSKDMVREMLDNPASYLQTLGGQRKEIVALFSDLRGFTSDSETMDPTKLVALLNDYFGEMVLVVFQKRGTLDKFMGDALMATWGALDSETPREDARNALRAAFEMRQRLADINSRRLDQVHWEAGIGISQGPVVFGNIGCDEKMDLTAIGDSVNLASRLEGLTRVYGCDILVDERVAENLYGECQVLLVDLVRVKGRQKSEKLFFPYPGDVPAKWAEDFAHAHADYREKKFAEAKLVFEKLASGGLAPAVAAIFCKRCEDFVAHPPSENWDGVWDYFTK